MGDGAFRARRQATGIRLRLRIRIRLRIRVRIRVRVRVRVRIRVHCRSWHCLTTASHGIAEPCRGIPRHDRAGDTLTTLPMLSILYM